MINKLIILLLVFTCIWQEPTYAQNVNDNTNNVLTVVDKMPEFTGGQQMMFVFLSENVNYPYEAKKDGVMGKVYVNFIVDTNGVISNTKIIKGVHKALDTEAVRVVNSMPPWIPGEQGGKKVSVSYNLPITFKLGIEHSLVPDGENEKYDRGVQLFSKGKYKKAIWLFSQSIEKKPDHIDSYYNRGVCYFKTEKKEAACKDWNKAKELGDNEVANLLEKHCQ